ATGEQFAEVAAGDETDVDAAVKAALRAFQGPWSKITPAERGRLLYRVAELIEARAEELAAAETLDSGKPLAANRHIDLPFCVDFWRFYAGAA
ncbi:aldehyde dehydrogenase family protein, partial [Escherichia coli]|nr:aldehyde dehydrogenase family protein [Escherichia coli]